MLNAVSVIFAWMVAAEFKILAIITELSLLKSYGVAPEKTERKSLLQGLFGRKSPSPASSEIDDDPEFEVLMDD